MIMHNSVSIILYIWHDYSKVFSFLFLNEHNPTTTVTLPPQEIKKRANQIKSNYFDLTKILLQIENIPDAHWHKKLKLLFQNLKNNESLNLSTINQIISIKKYLNSMEVKVFDDLQLRLSNLNNMLIKLESLNAELSSSKDSDKSTHFKLKHDRNIGKKFKKNLSQLKNFFDKTSSNTIIHRTISSVHHPSLILENKKEYDFDLKFFVSAFPYLFNSRYGQMDFDITAIKDLKSVLLYFLKHSNNQIREDIYLLFSCMGIILHKKLFGYMSYRISQKPNLSVKDLKDNWSTLNGQGFLYSIMSTIPGQPGNCASFLNDLMAMIKTIGPAKILFTVHTWTNTVLR